MSDKFRFRCNQGHVFDAPVGTNVCTVCGEPLVTQGCGVVQIHRANQGAGFMLPMEVYIDETPYGCLAKGESTRIVLPFGTHKIHMALGMNRDCTDLAFTITPECNYAYANAVLKMGFINNRILITPATAAEMPEV